MLKKEDIEEAKRKKEEFLKNSQKGTKLNVNWSKETENILSELSSIKPDDTIFYLEPTYTSKYEKKENDSN